MKIAFCIDSYRPSRGGAEAYLCDLARGLADRGHEIFVASVETDVSTEAEAKASNEASASAADFQTDTDSRMEHIPVVLPSGPRLRREARLARVPLKLKESGRFDAVVAFRHAFGCDLFQPHGGLHVESLKGAVRAAAAGGTARKLLYLRRLVSPKNLFFLHADRVLLDSRPPRVAALSNMTAAAITDRFGGAVDVTVIPNGVDTQRFHPGLRDRHRDSLLDELDIPRDSSVALFCGHNFVLKGLREALRAAVLFRQEREDFHLVIVGRRRQERWVRLAGKLGLDRYVRFLGERADMERLFGAADVLLHPTWYDPCSLVVLESLGAGVPVITSRFNGAAELMTPGREGVVLDDPRDAAATAHALVEVLGPGWSEFSRHAGELGIRCDFRIHLDRMEDLLAQCASSGRRR